MTEARHKREREGQAKHRKDAADPVCCPVVELRQYTLKHGRRDELIALFEHHFLEGQEQYGMQILGQFRRRTDPDQFVWLRGFPDMEARHRALQGFYSGPIWQEHRRAANDTMRDSDNVLLLKPARIASGLHGDPANRPAMDAEESAGGMVIATVYGFKAPVESRFLECFEIQIAPVLCEAGATFLGTYVTEPAENTFPQLPVREGEHVLVWFASFASERAYTAYQAAVTTNQTWITELSPTLQGWLARPEEVLELLPTRRSLVRHRSGEERARLPAPRRVSIVGGTPCVFYNCKRATREAFLTENSCHFSDIPARSSDQVQPPLTTL